jgi:hypothetical protein
MSVEFYPTAKIPWSTFFTSAPPEGLTYEPNPHNERGPIGLPDACLRITNGKAYAFAWKTIPDIGQVEGGTYFELFGANVTSDMGGVLLAAVAKHLGVQLIQQYGGALLTEDGRIDSDIYDDDLIKKANAALTAPEETPGKRPSLKQG